MNRDRKESGGFGSASVGRIPSAAMVRPFARQHSALAHTPGVGL